MFRLIAVLGLLLTSCIVSVAASPSATVHASQATPTAGGDLVLVAIADAPVEEASPNVNYGTSPRLRVDGGKDPAVESYLTFSVSDIPGPIGHAVLRLYATSDTKVGPAVYTTTSDWSETGITWANRPSHTTDPVASTGPVTPDMWVEFDVTAVV